MNFGRSIIIIIYYHYWHAIGVKALPNVAGKRKVNHNITLWVFIIAFRYAVWHKYQQYLTRRSIYIAPRCFVLHESNTSTRIFEAKVLKLIEFRFENYHLHSGIAQVSQRLNNQLQPSTLRKKQVSGQAITNPATIATLGSSAKHVSVVITSALNYTCLRLLVDADKLHK